MDTFYWTLEYTKVFLGYLFLMFLWPTVVFGRHLKKKSFTYRFCFCVTVQPVIVSTAVLIPGLFHVLDRKVIVVFFYVLFFAVLLYKTGKSSIRAIADIFRTKTDMLRGIRIRIKGHIWDLGTYVWPKIPEYILLLLTLIFGMIYFSYGAFQIHSYGFGDLYAHHAWIWGLMEGKIFSDGVYPEAMHCFVYCLNALFGIPVYSILLYLQCIHVVVFLLSAYCLMKEIFRWRYTPVLLLLLFLTLDVVSADQVYSISRLQWTLPLEFGLHTQFLCALFLVRYLKNACQTVWKGKIAKYYWNEDLFLFMMSLAASVAIHYYTTIMAFIVCVSFAVFALKKIFSREYLIPLTTAVLCGCLIAVIPMAGALASGIPFNYSIRWAVSSMNGESTRELQEEQEGEAEGSDDQSGRADNEGAEADRPGTSAVRSVYMAGGNASVKEAFAQIRTKLTGIYSAGYRGLYGVGRGGLFFAITILMIVLCIVGKRVSVKPLAGAGEGYGPMILASVLFILTYAVPYVGFPEIISDSRFCSAGHMMILAVVLMPVDMVFSMAAMFCRDSMLQILSFLSAAGIYVITALSGSYHGFLFYELTRYDSVVDVTNSIIETFPLKSYVIVSPTDELYPVIQDGWHQELLTFLEQSKDPDYTLSPEYIFFYVEKKPLLYAQAHFFTGPAWLGQEKYLETYWEKYSKRYPHSGVSQSPHIEASEISDQEAQKDMPKLWDSWQLYTRLESRTILESKAYDWCQRFMESYPFEMYVYYEDKDFVCYYLIQDVNAPYKLGVE